MWWPWFKNTQNSPVLRPLVGDDYPAAAAIMDDAPTETVLMRGWLDSPSRLGGSQKFLGYFGGSCGELTAVCWNGANIIPWGFDERGIHELAHYLTASRLVANSIVGDSCQVMPLWQLIKDRFAAPRDIREHQLSMVYRGGDDGLCVDSDPLIRTARTDEYSIIAPAAVAMFTEEVGYDPTSRGRYYSDRVKELLREQFTFVRIGQDFRGFPRVEFKADVGAYAGGVVQIQGVWVPPDLRGRGIAAPAMRAVAELVHARFGTATIVHLYVNDYNLAAVRTYEKAGFVQVGEYSTILL